MITHLLVLYMIQQNLKIYMINLHLFGEIKEWKNH